MNRSRSRCQEPYAGGYRKGQQCPYRATAIVARGVLSFACGYHTRAYIPSVVYPLDWNLARIRAWQLDNIRRLVS
jgi:hypothetical protein